MSTMMNMDASDWDLDMYRDMFDTNTDGYNLIFMLFDCSGSVSGTILGSIKNIMEEITSEHENSGIKTIVAQLSEKVIWMNEIPVDIHQFVSWRKISSDGCLYLGRCFEEISDKISEKKWLEFEKNAKETRFILISDGMSVDQYKTGLKKLKQNNIFANAKKYAINMMDVTWALQSEIKECRILSEFTGDSKFVIDASSMNSGEIEKVFEQIVFG